MSDLNHRLDSSLSDENFKLSCEIVNSKLVPVEQSVLDEIFRFKKSDQPEIITDDGKKYFWYLAIGSMINPISLFLRDLRPLVSYAATAQDYKLVFRSLGGMADIESSAGDTFDGVVHLMTETHMLELDKIEMSYRRVPVKCIDYQNKSQVAYAYQMQSGNLPLGIPSERYLDIIVKGCEYHKVRQEYIDKLRNNQPVAPRRKLHELRSFPNCPDDTYFTKEELAKHNGKDLSVPIWLAINGKILEHTGLPEKGEANYEGQKRFVDFACERLAGRDGTSGMAKALYDPLYKLPLNDDDISEEHRAQIEDSYYGMLYSSEHQNYWKVIGRLRQ